MAGAEYDIRVKGLREFMRATAVAERETKKLVRSELRGAAEPVRVEAEHLASSDITNIGGPWSRMRTGISASRVWVAPKERGSKSRTLTSAKRPNLAGLLMRRALMPALDAKQGEVVSRLEAAVDEIADHLERRNT